MKKHSDYTKLDTETLDHLLEGFQVIGHDWRYLYVNNTVVKQSKYSSKEDLIGYTMMEKYPGIESTRLFKVLKRCMSKRIPMMFDNEFVFPDNSKGWFELRIRPVPEGLFILSIDITERKKAEKNIKRYSKSLEEMLYMTSHKVRQPVANILGISNLLNGKIDSKDDIAKIVTYIKQSAHSLDNFTKELTSYMHGLKTKEE